MECEICGGRVMVLHTYRAGKSKLQDAACEACHVRKTLLTAEVASDPKYGEGAFAVAKKLRRGDTTLAELIQEG